MISYIATKKFSYLLSKSQRAKVYYDKKWKSILCYVEAGFLKLYFNIHTTLCLASSHLEYKCNWLSNIIHLQAYWIVASDYIIFQIVMEQISVYPNQSRLFLRHPNLTFYCQINIRQYQNPTFLEFSANFTKISRYAKEISDFLGNLTPTILLFKLSDPNPTFAIRRHLCLSFWYPLHH